LIQFKEIMTFLLGFESPKKINKIFATQSIWAQILISSKIKKKVIVYLIKNGVFWVKSSSKSLLGVHPMVNLINLMIFELIWRNDGLFYWALNPTQILISSKIEGKEIIYLIEDKVFLSSKV
jgi:hypothetical protein